MLTKPGMFAFFKRPHGEHGFNTENQLLMQTFQVLIKEICGEGICPTTFNLQITVGHSDPYACPDDRHWIGSKDVDWRLLKSGHHTRFLLWRSKKGRERGGERKMFKESESPNSLLANEFYHIINIYYGSETFFMMFKGWTLCHCINYLCLHNKPIQSMVA